MANIVKTIEIKGKGLRELRREYKDLRDEYYAATDPQRMEELAQEISAVTSHIDETNRQLKIMGSGSELQKFKSELGGVSSALKNLDFDTALSRAQNLSNLSFKGVMGSLKTLGKTFQAVGNALKTNPLVLLATIVGLIVLALVALEEELGILGKAFEILTIPIRAAIDLLKRFTDMIGLTNYKEQELANDRAERVKEDTKNLDTILDNHDSELKSEQKLLRAKGLHTKEDIARDHLLTMTLLNNSMKRLYQKDLEIKADREAFRASIKTKEALGSLTKEQAKAVEEAEEGFSNSILQNVISMRNVKTDMEVAKIEFDKKIEGFDNKASELDEDKLGSAVNTGKKIVDNSEKVAREQLKIARQLKDQEIALMDEGFAKEKAIIDAKYQRMMEDLTLNKELKGKELQQSIDNIDKLKEKELEALNESQGARQLANDLIKSETQKALDEGTKVYEESKKSLQEALDNELISQETFNKAMLALDKEYADLKKDLVGDPKTEIEQLQANNDAKLQKQRELLEAGLISEAEFKEKELELEEQFKKDLNMLLYGEEEIDPLEALKIEKEGELEVLQEALDKELISHAEFLEAKKKLDEDYGEREREIEEGNLEDWLGDLAKKIEKTKQYVDAVGNIMDSMFDAEIASAEGNDRKQEELRKKQFNAQKAVSLAMLAIDTSVAVLKTFSQYGFTPVGIAAAALQTGVGIAQAIAIKKQKYNSSTTPTKPNVGRGGGGSTPSLGGNSPQAPPSTPDFGFDRYERDEDYNIYDKPIVIENNVTVSETEITDSQRTVSNLSNYTNL